MRLIVLTFDRLPARLLACYGNEWMETPGFDQLAARSTVFERHFVELPGGAGPSHPWWTGQLEFFSGMPASSGSTAGTLETTIARLVAAGVNCHLIAERFEGLPLDAFSSCEEIGGADSLDTDHADTPFAKLVQRALEVIGEDSQDRPDLLWLHSRGVPSPWLPPRVFADLYLNELEDDEDEEEWDEHTGETILPGAEAEVSEPDPDRHFDPTGILDELAANPALAESILSEPASPDEPEREPQNGDGGLERLVSRYIFAGYVSLLDHWLGRLVRGVEEAVCQEESGNRNSGTTLVVSASGGHAVGDRLAFIENREEASELCDEQLQTPMLIHKVGSTEFGTRSQSLVGSQDLAPTLFQLLGIEAPRLEGVSLAGPGIDRDFLFHLSSTGEIAIRNHEWLLVLPDISLLETDSLADDDELLMSARLFALPDDVWQVNDVSSRRGDIVVDLAGKLQSVLRSAGRFRAE